MGKIFWFTGLSGAGKTTIARAAADVLAEEGREILIFDGDDVRSRLHKHLGFSREDILENNRLVAQMCMDDRQNADAIFVPLISPLEDGRRHARETIGADFRLVYFSAGLQHVAEADVKGLYRRARAGEIDNMIGVAANNPYEAPTDADVEIDISSEAAGASVDRFLNYVRQELSA